MPEGCLKNLQRREKILALLEELVLRNQEQLGTGGCVPIYAVDPSACALISTL